MKNKPGYSFFKLIRFTIILGIIFGLLAYKVTEYFDISRAGFFYSTIIGLIFGAMFPLLVAIMNKTGLDKFLRKEDKNIGN